MNTRDMKAQAEYYLHVLCDTITERCVGSQGNREATAFFERELSLLGWETETSWFDAMDWENDGAELEVLPPAFSDNFEVFVSPYSRGCKVQGELVSAASVEELKSLDAAGKILLLYEEIAKEPLMPKNFVFYNPEAHQNIITLLENSGCKALCCATGRNSATAGGIYPFPLIEDGDFDVPSVYMTEEEGERLLKFHGKSLSLLSKSRRIPGKGCNIKGKRSTARDRRIIVTAHIDAKKGSPGAIDNGTGVVILLLLANLFKNHRGETALELLAFNGEDYYAVPGQMKFLEENKTALDTILLNINIDGAGYKTGPSAFSFYNLPTTVESMAEERIGCFPDIVTGQQWPQGDHSIFLQNGVPALAISSKWLIEHMDIQNITHTPRDNPDIVDCQKLVDIADALYDIIQRL